MLEYCILGHHSGLPDGGTRSDSEYDSTLQGRLKRKPADYNACKDEISFTLPDMQEVYRLFEACDDVNERIELFAFFTRYVFSCLTDADFIDT